MNHETRVNIPSLGIRDIGKSPASTVEAYSTVQHSVNTMNLLRRDQKYCDAVIEAGGQKFKIHKSVFAIYSDYFDKVFTVEMQERSNNVVELENTRCDVMKCIVDFIYTGELSINRENAIALVVAADYLFIEKIKNLSTKYLVHSVDAENCVSVWLCAKTYNLQELLDKSLKIFGENLLSIPQQDLKFLDNEQFIEIMESSKEVQRSEEASFVVIATWTKCDLEKRKSTFRKMVPSFKFSLFSKDFLSNIAKDELLVSMSTEIWQEVLKELAARLDLAIKEDWKTCRKIADLGREKQVLANKVLELIEEKKRSGTKAQESVRYSRQAAERKDPETMMNDLIEENKRLKEEVRECQIQAEKDKREQQNLNRSLNFQALCKQVVLKHTQYLVHQIRVGVNDPTKLSAIWSGIFMNEGDIKFINDQLEAIVSNFEQYQSQDLCVFDVI